MRSILAKARCKLFGHKLEYHQCHSYGVESDYPVLFCTRCEREINRFSLLPVDELKDRWYLRVDNQ